MLNTILYRLTFHNGTFAQFMDFFLSLSNKNEKEFRIKAAKAYPQGRWINGSKLRSVKINHAANKQ